MLIEARKAGITLRRRFDDIPRAKYYERDSLHVGDTELLSRESDLPVPSNEAAVNPPFKSGTHEICS